ncbi:electron transfer flavoprotein subunit beta [Geosporobacter ferrireducens]|uniref:Electron transfer flavoprotein small subunit n=1 Tax=Geosporobacter ferrireducens TaxID=1424294 RepID=A0A1D8GGD5_9FIRM|nr:electron transfer flavoprotein subunit beta [Geosporobacter ferrireducens]AOT69982.1 electron transfer flavoprotein subunit beta [Geosporobacter ferrireducens]MTI53476.1 electron transfer flavoprotein subunit beta/FixA family protein [Geosporobacter ferrireducens]
MKIIVCVKQVPDTNEVKIDPVKGTLIREGVPSILNPDDKNALEEALALKDKNPAVHVTVITMGPPQADEMLRECLAMGADEAILLSDRAFAGADTWATSNTLAAAVRKIGNYDILFAGRQAIDGDTAQVGPQLAERLDIPQVTYVQHFEIQGEEILVQRALEDGYELIKAKTPVLLTAIKELNHPRYMSIDGIYDAFREKEVKVWTLADLAVQKQEVGLDASPTQVKRSFTPEPKGKGIMLKGNTKEMVEQLVGSLKQKHII